MDLRDSSAVSHAIDEVTTAASAAGQSVEGVRVSDTGRGWR